MNDCKFCKKHLEGIMACEDCNDGSDFEPIDKVAEVKNKLSNLMKMLDNKQSDDLINYINNDIDNMINETKKSKDILYTYKNYFNSAEPLYYFLDTDSAIDKTYYYGNYIECSDVLSNPYCFYPIKEYALKAFKLKKFNDMLLAFKYCYDRYHQEDLESDKHCRVYYCDESFRVYYCDESRMWTFLNDCTAINSAIYFSSVDIARKCVDWLNEIDPNGELIK